MPTRSSPAMGPRAGAGAAAGFGLGDERAAGFFFGAARFAGFLAGAFFLSVADFLRSAGFLAGAFLRFTLALRFFPAAMVPPSGVQVVCVHPSRPGPTYQSRPKRQGYGLRRERGYHDASPKASPGRARRRLEI